MTDNAEEKKNCSETPRRHAVIVDDDQGVCHLLQLILKRHFQTHIALRGDEGLELIREIKPHLAILDLVLPSIDGLTLCETIKKDEELKDIVVLIVTATTRHSDLADSFWKLGTSADGFLTKPFEPEVMLNTVIELIPRMRS